MIFIWVDGSCYPNPGGPGGWAAVFRFRDYEKVLSGRIDAPTTSPRAEVTAAIMALRALTRPCDLTLFTDSRYVADGGRQWMRGWERIGWDGVANADLWKQLREATRPHRIEWRWLRGHAGHAENERCDMHARRAREGRRAIRYPPSWTREEMRQPHFT